MIVGTGVDIVSNARIRAAFDRFGEKFAHRILHKTELPEFENKFNKVGFLCKRFAAKEAFVKALGTGFKDNIRFKYIYVTHDVHGKPMIQCEQKALQTVEELQISAIHLSISDELDYTIAQVITEK